MSKLGSRLGTITNLVVIGVALVYAFQPGGVVDKARERLGTRRLAQAAWSVLVTSAEGSIGRSTGPAVVVFSEYTCTHCKVVFDEAVEMASARADFSLAYHLMVGEEGSFSWEAAALATCASKEGRFEQASTALFELGREATASSTLDRDRLAVSLGLDPVALGECVEAETTRATLRKEQEWAVRLNVVGVPTFVTPRGMRVGRVPLRSLAN